MKKTILALTSALLLAGAGAATAQTYYYDYGYGQSPQYWSYDSDRDGVEDRYDRYDNRYDRYDDRYDRYDDRYAYSSRYNDRAMTRDRDCDGVPNRYDYNDRYNARDRDCDGIANRFDRIDDRTYRARTRYSAPTRYYAPSGYRYQVYDVGTYLPRGYYGSSYYIDYRPYGLSPPPYGYRWVRVGNDVYMVQTRNGMIVEAVLSLFR
jgi:Ni/Co efflux regulator RcnB